MPGTLYVVATPIGNLEDVTLRALRILREVSVIAAEDTRRTSRLLQHYSISTPTTSLHEHNEDAKTPRLVARLVGGESDCARVGCGDAGRLGSRRAARRRGPRRRHARRAGARPERGARRHLRVGHRRRGFVFVGFPPSRAAARREWLSRLARRTASARALRSASSNSRNARGHARRLRRSNGGARPGTDQGSRGIGR